MKTLRFCALAVLLLMPTLFGCKKEEVHSYPDYVTDASDKYNIDLSDDGRYSDLGELVIDAAGVYRISGSAEGKRIVVKAHPNAEILLSLEGVSLSNGTGSVISIDRAGSVRLTLAEGTENLLVSDGENRGGAPVIYSNAPLTVDGKGTLNVSSDNGAGIESSGELVLLGGRVCISSHGDALTARSFSLGGGELSVSSEAGGIRAFGKAEISGGLFFSDTAEDAVRAEEIFISGGRCDLSSERYVFNTKKDVGISGGEVFVCAYSDKSKHGIVSSDARIAHTGGQLVAVSGERLPVTGEALCSVNITLSDAVDGGIIKLTDKDGADSVKSERPRLPVRSVCISSPAIKQGETYAASIGEITAKVAQTELVSYKAVSTSPAKMTKHEYGGIKYLLYTPAYVSGDLPMVVFLHGGGEKGEDLDVLTLAQSLPKFLLDGTLCIDAYVLIPQLPKEEDGWYAIAAGLEALIEHSRETLPVIKDKVSLTGHSLGGGGVWMLALRHTERYSRIAPLSGWVDLNGTNLNKLSRIPVWDLVGELDTAVPPEESKPMTDALKAIGADVRSTVFLGAKHHEVPVLAYLDAELGLWDWLLS